jgi:hypothetical protein
MKWTNPTTLVLVFILLYAAVISMTTANLNRMVGDEGNHAAAGLLVHDIFTSWASNPAMPLSELKDMVINHHAHYKSFGSFMGYSPFHLLFTGLVLLLFGASRFTVLLPTIIESMVLLYFSYKLAKLSYKDEKVALLAVFLIAFNPIFFYFSTMVMLDVGSAMFLVITMYYFSLYLIENKNNYLYLAAIGAALAILTRPPMFLIIPVLFLTGLWEKRFSPSWFKRNWKPFLVSVILFLIFLSPWLIELAVLETQGISGLNKWVEHAGGFKQIPVSGFPLMDGTMRWLIHLSPPQNFVFHISSILYTWYLVPFFVLVCIFSIKKFKRLGVVEKGSLILISIFLIILSIWGGAQPRYVIYILPFYIIPTSKVIINIFKKIGHPVVIIIIILAIAQCSQFLIATKNAYPIGDFDKASVYVLSDTEQETTIISSQPRAQAFSLALLDKERKTYTFYMPKTRLDFERMLDGLYSDPEWESFGIKYPPIGYVIIHEEYPQMDDSEFVAMEFMADRHDFELVKTIEGETPNTRTFIYKRI